ncbi:hypothetical protein L6164_006148 [Bauhinia variegata]|uniref:Uncharacterized protein n=1 Tax=Bauhinia variegata TaxID=167791 RepID=A0ACB9PT18_BAUVA|nr:hypothetical protein L6164_006148 [Bauhinia variegata]
MSDKTLSPSPTVDPHQHLQIVLNPDGTLTRLQQFPCTSPTSDPNLPISVLTKDVTINQSNNTWTQIFLPRKALDNSSSNKKLPLIVFFHGSGFIVLSAASTIFHDFCVNMANDVEAVVVSVEYRLARSTGCLRLTMMPWKRCVGSKPVKKNG